MWVGRKTGRGKKENEGYAGERLCVIKTEAKAMKE